GIRSCLRHMKSLTLSAPACLTVQCAVPTTSAVCFVGAGRCACASSAGSAVAVNAAAVEARKSRRPTITRRPLHRPTSRAPQRMPIGEVGSPGTVPGVELLVMGELITPELGTLFRLDVIQARIVAAEDRGLDRAVGGTERLQSVFLFQFCGNLEPGRCLDLPF